MHLSRGKRAVWGSTKCRKIYADKDLRRYRTRCGSVPVRLGARGALARVEVDTRFFKGNAPSACSIDACTGQAPGDWQELLPRTALSPDRRHSFDTGLRQTSDITYVRLHWEFVYLAVLMDVFTRAIRGGERARSTRRSP